MAMAQIAAAIVPSRGATAAAMGRSTTLATTASGGRVRRAQVRTRGTGTCTPTTTK